MKLSKRFIMQVAEELRERQGKFTQIELHAEIERKLGRALDINEKRRITMIIRSEYAVLGWERDVQHNYIRIFFFF